jgi:hypothetical protein
MNVKNDPPAMKQMIFKMGLSMETISVYLLCCAFSDSGSTISTKNLSGVWNGDRETLLAGLNALEKRNILLKIISVENENNVYRLTAVDQWKMNKVR